VAAQLVTFSAFFRNILGFYIVISKKISNKENLLFYQRYARLHLSFHFDFSSPLFSSIDFSSEAYFAVLYTKHSLYNFTFLWYEGLKTVEAFSSAICLLLTIVVAAIISIIFLYEPFTLTLVLGSLLMCVGIWIVGTR